MKAWTGWMAAAVVAVCLGAWVSPAGADLLLQDLNSQVTIDLMDGLGMNRWTVDGVNQIRQQWFWFRVGNDAQRSLDALPLEGYKLTDGDWDAGNERLSARYGGNGFKVNLDFILGGGRAGTGKSDCAEIITISNTGLTPLDFHFYQYVNFTLQGDASDTSVQITGRNTAMQTDGLFSTAETVVTGQPAHSMVGTYPTILSLLNSGAPVNLTDAAGPLGPGDLSWAFQWDIALAPGQDFIISKDKNIVPEPAAMSVLLLGSLCAFVRRKKA